MYKLKTYTFSLLTFFMVCVMSACKDEPTVNFELISEDGNNLLQFPYGSTEITITFACSKDYLDLFIPSFAIHSSNELDLIKPTREDFHLSGESTMVSLVENGDTIEREMPVYTYSFDVALEGSEGFLRVFTIGNLIESWEEDMKNSFEIYRGYQDLNIKIYCPEGQYAISRAVNLYNVFGYKCDNNELEALIDLYFLLSKVPTLALNYESLEEGYNIPTYNIGVGELLRVEVEDYFNSIYPTTFSKRVNRSIFGSHSGLKGIEEKVKLWESKGFDFSTYFEEISEITIPFEYNSVFVVK